MAFGLNIDFSGIIGSLTGKIRGIVASKIKELSNKVKTTLINKVNEAAGFNLTGMIGTSLNLNLSKLTGGIDFANALKGLPFPNLGSLNLNALYGIIDENIGVNLNAFTSSIAAKFENISLDELSLNTKLTSVLDTQLDSIGSEIEAGIITGKSSIDALGSLTKLSNTKIRDFTIDPSKQLAFVNDLVEQQKNKIFDLSFNSIPESSIFDNEINSLKEDSLESFISTPNADFSFFDKNIIDEASISKDAVADQQLQITNITEVIPPVARNLDIENRYNKEEEMLEYLETFNDEFKVADNTDPVSAAPTQRYVSVRDPGTGEVIGIEDRVQGVIRPI